MALKGIIKKAVYGNIALYRIFDTACYSIPAVLGGRIWEVYITKRKFQRVFGRPLNLNDPQTLNEKIQWLKLNERDAFHTVCADKLAVREYLKQFGEENLVPLFFATNDWRKITREALPDVPCIVKCNSGSGCYQIIRNKDQVNIKDLQTQCRRWMTGNFYYKTQEWQYKAIKPCILVEKLLLDKNGHIPNDYKLHYINGELQFVYCSIDREGANYRSIYTPSWERMDMEWVPPQEHRGHAGADIPCPISFGKMKEIGDKIARKFKYVRVDFYDVDGKLYYGEITLHHGSGFDTFVPEKYDWIYGKRLKL